MKIDWRRNCLTYRQVNVLIFVLLLLTAVGFTDYILFTNWEASARQNAQDFAENTNSAIFRQIDTFIEKPRQVNDMNRKLLENGIVDIGSPGERERFFVSVLASLQEEIYSFSYGARDGSYYGARRDPAGVVQIMRNDTSTGGHSWYYSVSPDLTAGSLVLEAGKFDPRERDWYQAAVRTGQPTFSPIYKHFVMDDLTVSAVVPILAVDGRLEGVLGTHVILSGINRFLESVVRDNRGFAAIVERDTGALVANSFGASNFETAGGSSGEIRRFLLAEAGHPVVAEAFRRYRDESGASLLIRETAADGSSFYVQLTAYQKDGLDWVVITAIPESFFVAGIRKSVNLALLMTALVTLLAILVYLLLTNRYLKPIGSLIAATEKLSNGDLTSRVPIVRDDEIGRISHSFNNMADTLSKLVDHLEDTVRERTVALEASNENLRQADRNKNEFINALSHELRNPLAAIVASLSLYELSQDLGKRERAMDVIRRQTGQLSHLVDDLLDITRITRNKIVLRKVPVDIVELTARAVDGQRALFEAKGVQLELVSEIGADSWILDGDPIRLTQIIGNLLHNAYKFSENGGATWVSVRQSAAAEAVVCVRDNGAGIRPEFLPDLFEPFTQADHSLDRKHGGLGLGLSIVKGIAELHGGRVSVHSDGPGQGARFCIYLPLTPPADGPDPDPPVMPPPVGPDTEPPLTPPADESNRNLPETGPVL